MKANLQQIKELIVASDPFVRVSEWASNPQFPAFVINARGSMVAFVAAQAFEHSPHHLLLLASDEERAEKLRDDCAAILGDQHVRYFGARPTHRSQSLDLSSSVAQIETLKALTETGRFLVIASPRSVAETVPPPAEFASTMIELSTGLESNFGELTSRLLALGFDKKDFVEGYGDFAVRGGILDVYPYVGEHPVRVEFWGNTIESLREFDALSQRSIRVLERASIVSRIHADPLTADAAPDSVVIPRQASASIFDYLGKGAIVLLDEPAMIERQLTEIIAEGEPSLLDWETVRRRANEFPVLTHTSFPPDDQSPLIDLKSSSPPAFAGSVKMLVESSSALNGEGFRTYVLCDTKDEASRLRELIEDVITDPSEANAAADTQIDNLIQLIPETIHSGFVYHPLKIALFTEHEVFGRLKQRGLPKRRRFKGISQKELHQLRPGDYVVHIDHGIGVFERLTKINVGGTEQEVMKVSFAEKDVLYVNLNALNRVQKYSSQEGHVPKLTRLGGGEWERLKSKAKKRIKDIARDLIALYARRKNEKGFAFSSDSHWQKEMEASFMYEDTPDQAQSTLDVKRDMEAASPMDRLVCGDVGFGKTEVAVRAAFKAVADGKQVGILVPTTILAMQHHQTFRDRLHRYGVRVDNLTRFKSAKEQKAIVQQVKDGQVDIIIGTHRLLSKDIGFKDLGLLIIDEEHRFGVAAKEKLRQFKATVDTLTLTATPIPRTLHFSLIGARDLSLINTPPRNRLPVVTDIVPADAEGRQTHWRIIREAILHEIHRGGQAYVVHDRVTNIDGIAAEVKKHVPEARVHVAHGQMPGHQLEKTMLDFLEKRYDVLVCTKIIESGLDIPNANTIVVNRADRFGMAELYQLRGRVGRSNVQAYAYLLTPPLGVLPRATLRRLQAIEEFAELGSGFNLAMRDLEIRGTGNLLGAEQSGFILDMGFEMYERIVREAVAEIKSEDYKEVFSPASGGLPATEIQTAIDSDIEALIPDIYIEHDAERLDVYRRLYRAVNQEEIRAMRDELRDRFGEYPEEVEHLFSQVELRLIAGKLHLQKLELKGVSLTLTLPDAGDEWFYGTIDAPDAPFQRIIANLSKRKDGAFRFKEEASALKIRGTINAGGTPADRLRETREKIEELAALAGL